jgi:hypothetical protein
MINGPAVLYVGTGTTPVHELLAVTESGVRIGYRHFYLPIHTDVSGPRQPADFQKVGMIGMVSGKMVSIDPVILDKVRKRGDATAVGQLNTTGLLMGAGGHSFALWVDGTGGKPHKFANAILWEDEDELVGTRRTEDDISFYAWALISATDLTAKDKVLWTYERPPGL